MPTTLGRPFPDGAVITRQGDPGDCLFVIQEGAVELVRETPSGPVRIGVLQAEEFFGELTVFGEGERDATARAFGEARVLTVDKATLLRRIREDPYLAVDMLGKMSHRLADLAAELSELRPRARRSGNGKK
jgi:CRP-like cAMP-binding protein